jgi:hypothetical protein
MMGLFNTIRASTVKGRRGEMHKQQQKMVLMSDVVLFGVPERKEALPLAQSLMKVLVLEWKGNLDNVSIESDIALKPIPLLIGLDNHTQEPKAPSPTGFWQNTPIPLNERLSGYHQESITKLSDTYSSKPP